MSDLLESMVLREVVGSEIQGSSGWLDARKGNLTGSKIREYVSLTSDSLKSSHVKYLEEKAAEVVTGQIEVIKDNEHMRRGREMEPVSMDWLADHLGVELHETGAIAMPWSDRVMVSPDRIGLDRGDKIVCESKSPKSTTHLRYLNGGKVPSDHKIQCQAELMVTGADYGYFISFDDRCIGAEVLLLRYEHDLKIQKRIKENSELMLAKLDKMVNSIRSNAIDINKYF